MIKKRAIEERVREAFYLFMAALGLHCYAQAFSGCSKLGLHDVSFAVMGSDAWWGEGFTEEGFLLGWVLPRGT